MDSCVPRSFFGRGRSAEPVTPVEMDPPVYSAQLAASPRLEPAIFLAENDDLEGTTRDPRSGGDAIPDEGSPPADIVYDSPESIAGRVSPMLQRGGSSFQLHRTSSNHKPYLRKTVSSGHLSGMPTITLERMQRELQTDAERRTADVLRRMDNTTIMLEETSESLASISHRLDEQTRSNRALKVISSIGTAASVGMVAYNVIKNFA